MQTKDTQQAPSRSVCLFGQFETPFDLVATQPGGRTGTGDSPQSIFPASLFLPLSHSSLPTFQEGERDPRREWLAGCWETPYAFPPRTWRQAGRLGRRSCCKRRFECLPVCVCVCVHASRGCDLGWGNTRRLRSFGGSSQPGPGVAWREARDTRALSGVLNAGRWALSVVLNAGRRAWSGVLKAAPVPSHRHPATGSWSPAGPGSPSRLPGRQMPPIPSPSHSITQTR